MLLPVVLGILLVVVMIQAAYQEGINVGRDRQRSLDTGIAGDAVPPQEASDAAA